jgi:FkbM family methyltransferase
LANEPTIITMNKYIDNKLKTRLYFVKLFDKVCCLSEWRKFQKIVTECASTSDNFFFVQIGANDGVIYDPIHEHVTRYNWSGILVEPVGCYFSQLKRNYESNTNLIFENVAISDREEIRDFYRVKEGVSYLPRWCNGLGTFYLEVLLTHKWAIPNIEDYVVKERVKCISFKSLLKRYKVKMIDLLLIDTEGHDYEIIKQIDFDYIKPRMIMFEHQYIGKKDRNICDDLLKTQDYSLTRHLGNTFAFLPNYCRQNRFGVDKQLSVHST